MKGWQLKIMLEIGIYMIEELSRMKMIDLMWFNMELLDITLFLHYRQIKGVIMMMGMRMMRMRKWKRKRKRKRKRKKRKLLLSLK
jgi:hypothetical protein